MLNYVCACLCYSSTHEYMCLPSPKEKNKSTGFGDTEVLLNNRILESELRYPTGAANIPNPWVFSMAFRMKSSC